MPRMSPKFSPIFNPHYLSLRLSEIFPSANFIKKAVFSLLWVLAFCTISIEEARLILTPASLHAQETEFEAFFKTAIQQIDKVTSEEKAKIFVQDTMGLFIPNTLNPVSYTHLTLPTNREV